MIYFIITTSLYNECNIRKNQYINGINKLKEIVKELNIENYKIVVVENNGYRVTFLDSLHDEIFYTRNNSLKTRNIGYKELLDIIDCIYKYKMNDDDFIVKMTGRYILNNDSEFMKIIKNIHITNYDCVIKYGSFMDPSVFKKDDCITGLIGMKCFYIKKIEKPNGGESIEWKWAKVTKLIDDKKIYIVDKLGINICPGSNKYFLV